MGCVESQNRLFFFGVIVNQGSSTLLQICRLGQKSLKMKIEWDSDRGILLFNSSFIAPLDFKKWFLNYGCITTLTESCTLIFLEHCQIFLIRNKHVEKLKLLKTKEGS